MCCTFGSASGKLALMNDARGKSGRLRSFLGDSLLEPSSCTAGPPKAAAATESKIYTTPPSSNQGSCEQRLLQSGSLLAVAMYVKPYARAKGYIFTGNLGQPRISPPLRGLYPTRVRHFLLGRDWAAENDEPELDFSGPFFPLHHRHF